MNTVLSNQKNGVPAVETGKIEAIERKADQVLTYSQHFDVSDAQSFERAVEFTRNIKTLMQEINDTFDPIIKIQHEAHKKTVAAKRFYAKPLEQAEGIIKEKMKTYHLEQERLRREEEARLRREAEEAEQKRRYHQALTASRSGQHQEAQAILAHPVIAPPAQLSSSTEHEAVQFRDVWRFEIINESMIPDQYKTIDEKKIRAVVKALKDRTSIPGVRVYCDKTVATRRN